MKRRLRILALTLSVLLAVTMLPAIGFADAADEEVTLTLMFGEHATELYHEDTWVIIPWAKEHYNVNLAITAIPSSDWSTKQSTVIASGDIPDLLMGIGRDIANDYGPKGLFLNLYDYIDEMPDMVECMERLPLLKDWMYYSDNEI